MNVYFKKTMKFGGAVSGEHENSKGKSQCKSAAESENQEAPKDIVSDNTGRKEVNHVIVGTLDPAESITATDSTSSASPSIHKESADSSYSTMNMVTCFAGKAAESLISSLVKQDSQNSAEALGCPVTDNGSIEKENRKGEKESMKPAENQQEQAPNHKIAVEKEEKQAVVAAEVPAESAAIPYVGKEENHAVLVTEDAVQSNAVSCSYSVADDIEDCHAETTESSSTMHMVTDVTKKEPSSLISSHQKQDSQSTDQKESEYQLPSSNSTTNKEASLESKSPNKRDVISPLSGTDEKGSTRENPNNEVAPMTHSTYSGIRKSPNNHPPSCKEDVHQDSALPIPDEMPSSDQLLQTLSDQKTGRRYVTRSFLRATLTPSTESTSRMSSTQNASPEDSDADGTDGKVVSNGKRRRHKKKAVKAKQNTPKLRSGQKPIFPFTLARFLREVGNSHPQIIHWANNGESFFIQAQPKQNSKLVGQLVAPYFNHSNYDALRRQLNLYGFSRLANGPNKGSWYNPLFHRDHLTTENISKLRVGYRERKKLGYRGIGSEEQQGLSQTLTQRDDSDQSAEDHGPSCTFTPSDRSDECTEEEQGMSCTFTPKDKCNDIDATGWETEGSYCIQQAKAIDEKRTSHASVASLTLPSSQFFSDSNQTEMAIKPGNKRRASAGKEPNAVKKRRKSQFLPQKIQPSCVSSRRKNRKVHKQHKPTDPSSEPKTKANIWETFQETTTIMKPSQAFRFQPFVNYGRISEERLKGSRHINRVSTAVAPKTPVNKCQIFHTRDETVTPKAPIRGAVQISLLNGRIFASPIDCRFYIPFLDASSFTSPSSSQTHRSYADIHVCNPSTKLTNYQTNSISSEQSPQQEVCSVGNSTQVCTGHKTPSEKSSNAVNISASDGWLTPLAAKMHPGMSPSVFDQIATSGPSPNKSILSPAATTPSGGVNKPNHDGSNGSPSNIFFQPDFAASWHNYHFDLEINSEAV